MGEDSEGEFKEMEEVKRIKELLEEKKGENIVILDLSEVSNLAHYFIIASANSPVHAKAMAEYLMEKIPPEHTEGFEHGRWILLDYGEIIVHIFLPEVREYYSLEWLWSDAKRVEL